MRSLEKKLVSLKKYSKLICKVCFEVKAHKTIHFDIRNSSFKMLGFFSFFSLFFLPVSVMSIYFTQTSDPALRMLR